MTRVKSAVNPIFRPVAQEGINVYIYRARASYINSVGYYSIYSVNLWTKTRLCTVREVPEVNCGTIVSLYLNFSSFHNQSPFSNYTSSDAAFNNISCYISRHSLVEAGASNWFLMLRSVACLWKCSSSCGGGVMTRKLLCNQTNELGNDVVVAKDV